MPRYRRNGVPVGDLTPLRRLRFVTAESVTEIFGTATAINAERFRRDLDELAARRSHLVAEARPHAASATPPY